MSYLTWLNIVFWRNRVPTFLSHLSDLEIDQMISLIYCLKNTLWILYMNSKYCCTLRKCLKPYSTIQLVYILCPPFTLMMPWMESSRGWISDRSYWHQTVCTVSNEHPLCWNSTWPEYFYQWPKNAAPHLPLSVSSKHLGRTEWRDALVSQSLQSSTRA